MSEEEVLAAIDEGFRSVARPEQIVAPDADSCGQELAQFLAVREALTLKDFIDCPCDGNAALGRMTPEAAAYFLPHFMKLCIRHFDVLAELPMSVVMIVSERYGEQPAQWQSRMQVALGERGRVAIRTFLLYLLDRYRKSERERGGA